ncbi:hypothetical protein BGX28_002449, partial [Mortierella sp. GBA30]
NEFERKKIRRLKSPQTFHRYRTMESPAPNGPKNSCPVPLALTPAAGHDLPLAPPLTERDILSKNALDSSKT